MRITIVLFRRSILVMLLCLAFISLYGQSATGKRTLTGTVTDHSGEPLIGVNVMEKNTTNGTITDIDGKYSLSLTKTSNVVLTFSYIGYIQLNVDVKGDNVVNAKLEEDTQNLEEVVVIGYGTAKKRDLTGAISSIKTEKLEAESPRSVEDLLRSNSPGLNISLSPNADGSAHLKIRGETTLKAGAAPLLVLDGVIYEGSLTDINPNDIQAVDVLKDASSAAVYGAKAANGVIMITTKKGKTGKPVVSFNANIGLATVANKPKLLDGPGFIKYRQDYENGRHSNDYLEKYPQIFSDPRQLNGVSQLDWYNYDQKEAVGSVTEEQLMQSWLTRLELKAPEIDNYMNGVITRWDDLVFQTAIQQDYTASISNRTDNMSYYWSIGYADREGIKVGNRYQNLRTRLNLESKVTDFLTIGVNAGFASRDQGFLTCDWGQMVRISPYGSNNLDDPDSPYRKYPTSDVTPVNPFYDNLHRDRKDQYQTLNANIYAKVTLPLGFEYQVNFAPNYKWREYYNHESSLNESWNHGGKSERRNEKTYSWQVDNILRWKKEFNRIHNIELTFLQNAEKNQYWETKAMTSNFSPSDILGYHRLQAGTVPLNESKDTYRTGDALMARAFYSYDNKYMVTASVRRDGYSAFGQMNPRATFPAVALGWVFTSEKFMESTANWLNYGKLRLSWGENGNRDIEQYQALAEMNSGAHPYIDQNGNIYISSQLYINRMSNKTLKWERTSAYNLGLDFSVFGDVLSGSVEAYLMETNDLLVDRSLPTILGFSSVAANLGKLENKGFEINLNASIMKKENFEWNATGNFALNRRKIKSLYGDMTDVIDDKGNVIGQKETDDTKNQWFIGQDPDRIWDYESLGIWQLGEEEEAAKFGLQPGDFKYKDQNGDGVLTNDDKVFQKYRTPRFTWSLRNEFTFHKNFSVSFMMYSHWGVYNKFNRATNAENFADRCSEYVQPRWTVDNPINDYARIGSKKTTDVWWNKSFIRLDNITLSYNVPKTFVNRFRIQDMRLSFGVKNVFVFAPDWKFWDPEQVKYYKDSNGDDNRHSIEPTPRTYNFSINFTL